ncbi:MAG: multidrug efflux RND transporter permease subunit [Desulfarculaceae bacterium]|nr:multidrug efflux RND transporter permease subunit [Desulfarculaceae bacterium]MCF8047839.1 multidrug efflux RND transporter permease subunit [Desulfarculaceae bacterium]MCF8064654.1 multidrug efflux RND transporter permease subunit [Desulfarculaceae bacterium]MCF8100011.1 multidrug efflux RND transporter permease subunit [Desulfarculaceae bacterium]MCF8124570.1 multidrug efflux RND transporter permease subunit [Desulfarculaceae bacterium]
MFSRFFINRPIFAAVVSIIIVLGGSLTLLGLPISQYPNIEPPTVTVTANYPGANATVVSATVAQPIEEQVNGVEGMIYMSSNSASDGSYTLTVTFETGTDQDMAQVLVQNRVGIATPKLPEEVRRLGVTTKKKSTNFAMCVNLLDTKGLYDSIFLANYATISIKDELARVYGVGDVQVYGAGNYSMRLWLDPQKLKTFSLTTDDVASAIQEQNVQVAAGVIGQSPAPKGQNFQLSVNVLGRLTDVAEFEQIIIKTGSDGRIVRVKDVARVELGAQTYTISSQMNKKPSATIMVYQLPGANLLQISDNCRQVLKRLSSSYPEGLEVVVTYDASDVVRASIQEIIETLIIAAILVILTVFVFLQDIRATLIPAITIPVSLIGTFAVMGILGFSINTLTLFGLVLAIGIVVDDAIVVVENCARNIDEHGLSSKEAAIKSMEEISGAVIATTLVLLAVFIPTAFMGGMTGILYKQFALTIATATFFSSINALTMSPALCALLLRPSKEHRNWFWRGFNAFLSWSTNRYEGIVGLVVHKLGISMVVYVILSVVAFYTMVNTPTGFVPVEDQGYAVSTVQLPDGASMERTQEVLDKVNNIIAETPGIQYNIAFTGLSLLDSTANSNTGAAIVVYKSWDDRAGKAGESQQDMLMRINYGMMQIQEATVMAFPTPALPGLGLAGGFEYQLQDRGALGSQSLQNMAYEIIQDGNAQSGLTGMYTTFRADVPQLFVDVDRTKVKTLGIPLSTVFDTLQAYLGSSYVNDFNKFGRTFQVNMQAEARFRAKAHDISNLQVRNALGDMVPMATLATIKNTVGPQVVPRFNLYPSATIRGNAAPGYSSGQAIELLANMSAQKLPASMGYAWSGITYQEVVAGGSGAAVFVVAVIFVFLVLAAQYESWKLPLPVILAVPLALLGAFAAVQLRSLDNNVYTQIGLVLLIGLATKNAILIVEFARDLHTQGKGIVDAAMEASKLRFRPILMTAFSFILGTLPLVVATGAGAGSRIALGTAVFGGMLAATFLGVVFVPGLFVLFERIGSKKKKALPEHASAPAEATGAKQGE